MDNFTNDQSGPCQRNRLIGLLETDDSIQEDKPASSTKEERSGQYGKKGEPRPLETPYQKESSDYSPKVMINLNYRPGLVSNQKDPNRFDRDRLFSAVSRGSPEALDGLLDYLRRTSKFLTNSEYTDAKTGKTCLMKALLNLKNGRNDTIPLLLEIDQKTQNPRPLVNVACSDCYYRGQTALHIAIEKRSLDLVKVLVEHGADVHARAHGEFFGKKKEGVCFYFGELPLSLAACTNQFEVVEYLLNNPHQKARLQEQDTLGNTVLHALVMIADDTEENTKFVSTIYVEILKAGVKTDPTLKLEEVVNYDGLNPLQLAAKTGKVEIFKHIIQREIKDPVYRHLSRKFTEWTYGPIHVSLYDLSSLDSFEENSVLEILAYSSDTPNRYKMVVLEPLNKLLQQKWETFASKRFYFSFISYLSFMIIFTAIAYYQPLRVKPSFPVEFTAGGFLWVSGLIIILLGGVYLIFAQSLYLRRRRQSLKTMCSDSCVEILIFIQAFSLLLSAVLYGASSENYVAVMVFSLLLGWVNMLYYTRGFQRIGIYSVMIQKTILRDLLRFLLVYIVFLFGFAAALVTLLGDAPSLSQNKSVAQLENAGSHAMYGGLLSVSLELFKITIGMGDLDFHEHARFRYFVMLLLLLFVILTYILLLNMLIALMSETVTDISDNSKSVWKLQRAIAILEIEKAWLWRQGGKRRSGCLMSVGLNKKDERWCFRVEEIKWTSWAKEVGVLKEEPGKNSDSEVNPEETRSRKQVPQKQLRSAVSEEQSLPQPQLPATEMMPLKGQTRNL
ncbi:transient receptor potential cation channel subfamily V member 2-like isoform X1 [Numida meleagris]|uniref:transient receptor potential cation channel subfamily V member 2-like isoform X1 n=1 Tax=Numida meleagris TaxID=8996 RepID=UPI000B3E0BE7|nr:transient receptor potential cation channel subfamily V member 2-like isoform X1 [Numida meleagris]XP_021271182.1 transient receptor potential cation channel subfamily V member 2-like isoform X1 [Numida meleagris]XP_021271183.1 transient receptor potential cation channel subfamily V member 2-like isoform X1 [Numida meleagris]XP_021271184.1 transient receptor potential cation channel subfamily V member 2-like isoform X1 [Numida meleagris]XP_021271185.1 transient receptor potential cation chan